MSSREEVNLYNSLTPQLKDIWNKLLPYQREGTLKMILNKSALQHDEMGLGKTIQTLFAVETQKEKGITLIICPVFALEVWKSEITKWLNKDAVIYTGTPKKRIECWNTFMSGQYDYIITNFAQIKEIGWLLGCKHKLFVEPSQHTGTQPQARLKAVILDEAHMSGIFNVKNKAFKLCDKLFPMFPIKYILTGTPVRQGCIDLYGSLHLLDRTNFPSYWDFVNHWCVKIQTPFGMEIERNPANLKAWRNMLSKYQVRRKSADVLTQLPGKRRQKLIVKMSKEQERLYKQLEEDMLALIPDNGDIVITPTVMTQILRQRQVLASPALLGSKDRGSGVNAIIDHSHLDLDQNVPVVVFTTFRALLPILKEAFEQEYPGIPVYEIKGGLSAEEFGTAWKSFQNGTGKAVLLVVIKSGASFHATRAHTAYFIGPEWDATLNVQAEDRLNRIGQKNFVNIFYVSSETLVEQRVWSLLNNKTEASIFITGTEQEYLQALKKRQK